MRWRSIAGRTRRAPFRAALPYPGQHDWRTAWLYYRTAVATLRRAGLAADGAGRRGGRACAARVLAAAAARAAAGVFYVWSMHSSGGTPIHVPELWPHSYYNTRYGLAALPLLAFAAAALVTAVPAADSCGVRLCWSWSRARSTGPLHRRPENWITWAESRANSTGRRAWTNEAADVSARSLSSAARESSPRAATISSGSTASRASRCARRSASTTDCPGTPTMQRPELYLWEQWAVVRRGDEARAALDVANERGVRYRAGKNDRQKRTSRWSRSTGGR